MVSTVLTIVSSLVEEGNKGEKIGFDTMEAHQNEKPIEAETKNDKNPCGEVSTSIKPKSEESDQQNMKKSKHEKVKKKDEKSVDQVLKALNSLGTSEEKLAAMCKKYSDMVEENRKLQSQLKQSEKRTVALQREKDQIQFEQSKVILTRSRLENLCRELQKQNKAIKEESLLKIHEEEEKRKVVSVKLQTALAEITALMQQNNENYSKLKEENLEMQNKFKTLCEQYELREQQVEKMSKQMQLEAQLADVKLAKVKIDMFAEKESLANDKEQLLVELTAFQNKCQEMQKTEVALRNQITMYSEKYDEFQSALAKSNQIYSGFKSEIEKMAKKISKLEKETSVWKMKWEGSHKALLQMAAEKQQRDAELALATRQLNQLQKLCRTLQAERTSLIMQLKSEGYTPKTGGVNDEARTSEKLQDGVNKDSQSNNAKEISNPILEDNVEIDNCTSELDKKLIDDISKSEKIEKEDGTQLECNIQKETTSETLNSVRVNTEISEPVKIEKSMGHKNQTTEKNQLKVGELTSDRQSNTTIESGKANQNCVKPQNVNETKKGKDGTRKKKK